MFIHSASIHPFTHSLGDAISSDVEQLNNTERLNTHLSCTKADCYANDLIPQHSPFIYSTTDWWQFEIDDIMRQHRTKTVCKQWLDAFDGKYIDFVVSAKSSLFAALFVVVSILFIPSHFAYYSLNFNSLVRERARERACGTCCHSFVD